MRIEVKNVLMSNLLNLVFNCECMLIYVFALWCEVFVCSVYLGNMYMKNQNHNLPLSLRDSQIKSYAKLTLQSIYF